MSNIEHAKNNRYKFVTWSEFRDDGALPSGLYARASLLKDELEARGKVADCVMYDPLDDDQGWLLLGENVEALADEWASNGPGEAQVDIT